MRTFLAGLSVLLCGLLFLGAVNAPVMQSQSFYINDHAGVIAQENRDSMLQAAQKLYDETGVRAVLLTIENLDGYTPEEYAKAVYNAWELGADGAGLLLLLSIEEKRFAVWSNADISVADAIAEADGLAGEEQFDLAAIDGFSSVIYNIYSQYPTGVEAKPESSRPETVRPEASAPNQQRPPVSHITSNTQDTATSIFNKDIMILLLIMAFIFISMRSRISSMKRRKKASENIYLRKVYSYEDTPIAVRMDDIDHPSGFGGLGNRRAIYLEDVDDADDVGIIKRKPSDASGGEAVE